MRTVQIEMPAPVPTATVAFYRDVLGLPLADDGAVRVGASRLVVRPGAASARAWHLAFNIPRNRLEAAAAWLAARVPLLADAHGATRFTFGNAWRSESVYFDGPDGAVLELIARQRVAADGYGAFGPEALLSISEIGLPCADVAATAAACTAVFGLGPLSPPSPVFAPMGDDAGLLILGDAQRRWFPDQTRLPRGDGLRVHVRDVRPGVLADASGWQVRAD